MDTKPTFHRLNAKHFQVSLMGSGYGNIHKAGDGKWYGDVRWIGGNLRKQFGKASTRKAIQTKIEEFLIEGK